MSQLGVVLEEMHGDAVPPNMAGDVLFNPRLLGVFLHDFPRIMLVDRLSSIRDKELIYFLFLDELRASVPHVGSEIVFRLFS